MASSKRLFKLIGEIKPLALEYYELTGSRLGSRVRLLSMKPPESWASSFCLSDRLGTMRFAPPQTGATLADQGTSAN